MLWMSSLTSKNRILCIVSRPGELRAVSSERGFQTDERDIARSREKRRDRGSNGAISNNELTEKNLVETHEGGLEQDDGENKNKLEEALGAGAKVLD